MGGVIFQACCVQCSRPLPGVWGVLWHEFPHLSCQRPFNEGRLSSLSGAFASPLEDPPTHPRTWSNSAPGRRASRGLLRALEQLDVVLLLVCTSHVVVVVVQQPDVVGRAREVLWVVARR